VVSSDSDQYVPIKFNSFASGRGQLTFSSLANASSIQNEWGYLSGFNIWNRVVSPDVVKMASFGCGSERGDIISWSSVLAEVDAEERDRNLATCEDVNGKQIVLEIYNNITIYYNFLLYFGSH